MSAQEGPRPPATVFDAEAPPPFGEKSRGVGERQILTALSYDLVGSTGLLESLDIEDYQELISDFQQAAKQAIESNSGMLRDMTGDGGLALFPMEMDPKDAAALAINAGLEIIASCRRVGRKKNGAELQIRVGIATSLFLINDGDSPDAPSKITGAALVTATRLQELAGPDTVTVSHDTRLLVARSYDFASQGEHIFKGFSEPQQVWRAKRPRRTVDRFFAFGRLSGPLVNRKDELQAMAACWSKVVRGQGQVLLFDGEAGIGKSRLVHEIRNATRFQRARLLLFQCLPGGSRSTLHPLLSGISRDDGETARGPSASIVNQLFREKSITDSEAIDVFSFLLGVEGAGGSLREVDLQVIRERTNWAVRRCLEQLCVAGPVIIVLEDIHWSDFTTRQLLTEAAQNVAKHPVMLVLTSRLMSVVSWLNTPNLNHVSLQPLGPQATQQAIMSRLSADAYAMLDLIERVSGGLPLFIEEICQWATENIQSAREELSSNRNLGKSSAFETVVKARLNAMGSVARIAEAASAVGDRFSLPLLCELLPDADTATIQSAFDELVKAGLLTQVSYSNPDIYGFCHALVQETIYRGLLRTPRREYHRLIFGAIKKNRNIASWIRTAALAEHAERAELIDDAIQQFVAAGHESAARSAVAEARQILEHALVLTERVSNTDMKEVLQLSAMSALGPVLTTSEGPGSPPARKLYEDGVEIARRRPMSERARWFPIFWGWWFTGTDVNGERAHALLEDIKHVDDSEAQLQARHCVWAIDFYLGLHENCIAAVDEGLPLYKVQPGSPSQTLYGGHDTKVCGLAHRGLALWFNGKPASALHSMREAKAWALQGGHVGSIAHAFNNAAMLCSYRRDFTSLRGELAAIRELTGEYQLPTLEATAQILEGWCEAMAGDAERGRDMIRAGLVKHSKLQTPEDYPVYCCMLAEAMVRTGDLDEGLGLLASASETAESSGHRYWLSEVHRRLARLRFLRGRSKDDVVEALARSLAFAAEQKSVPVLLAAYADLKASRLSPDLVRQYSGEVAEATARTEPGAPLFVNVEAAMTAGNTR